MKHRHSTGNKTSKVSTAQPGPSRDELVALVNLFGAGRYFEVETLTRLLTLMHPDSGLVWKILSAAQLSQGKDALEASEKAAAFLPTDIEAQSNLGNALRARGRLTEAQASHRHVVQLKPDYAPAHYNLAIVLSDQGQPDEAVASYQKALALQPALLDAQCNLGAALNQLGRYDDAVAGMRRALQLDPKSADAHNNLGNLLKDMALLHEAAACFREALALRPDFAEAHSNLLFAMNYMTDVSPADLVAEARRYGERVAQRAKPFTNWSNDPDPQRPLRIGFVSGDLSRHPVGYFIEGVFAVLKARCADRLSLHVYASNTDRDALTERIQSHVHQWRMVAGQPDESLAGLIRDDGIDILIDLSGHTGFNRLPMFAWKPAPVQLSWLGYFATTGVAAIDHVLADPYTVPECDEALFTEHVWRLPETRMCFTPPDVEVPVAGRA